MNQDREPTLKVELTLNVPARRARCEVPSKATHEPAAPAGRLPRISRLMALAINFQAMIDRGEIRDHAELSRLGYVSRARITQIMNLLNLAPDIQEEILHLEPLGPASASLRESSLRSLVSLVPWTEQRQSWRHTRMRMSARIAGAATERHK